MAELLVYNMEHFMDVWPTSKREKELENPSVLAKYKRRYQRGDPIQAFPNGFWTDGKRKKFGSHAFALVVMPWLSLKEAIEITKTWFRQATILPTLTDSVNHIYEYTALLNITSTLEEEPFGDSEFLGLPADISIISRLSNSVGVRFEPLLNPKVKIMADIFRLQPEERKHYKTPEQRYEGFEIKDEITQLKRLLKRRQYQLDLTKIPLENSKAVLTKIEDAHIIDKSIL